MWFSKFIKNPNIFSLLIVSLTITSLTPTAKAEGLADYFMLYATISNTDQVGHAVEGGVDETDNNKLNVNTNYAHRYIATYYDLSTGIEEEIFNGPAIRDGNNFQKSSSMSDDYPTQEEMEEDINDYLDAELVGIPFNSNWMSNTHVLCRSDDVEALTMSLDKVKPNGFAMAVSCGVDYELPPEFVNEIGNMLGRSLLSTDLGKTAVQWAMRNCGGDVAQDIEDKMVQKISQVSDSSEGEVRTIAGAEIRKIAARLAPQVLYGRGMYIVLNGVVQSKEVSPFYYRVMGSGFLSPRKGKVVEVQDYKKNVALVALVTPGDNDNIAFYPFSIVKKTGTGGRKFVFSSIPREKRIEYGIAIFNANAQRDAGNCDYENGEIWTPGSE